MLHQKLRKVNKGSSLTFSAQGGRGKEKFIVAAKIFRRRSEGAAEGGCGGNSAAPEPEAKPRRLLVQSRSQQKSFLFLLEKIGRAQIKNAEKTFLPAGERQRAAAGRNGWFRSGISDKMSSSQVVKTHQKGNCKSELAASLCSAARSYCIFGSKQNSRFRLRGRKIFNPIQKPRKSPKIWAFSVATI